MRRSRAEANRAYAGATVGVIGTLLALSLTVWLFRPATLDPETLCPVGRPLAGHTVVIIDRTDRWSPEVGNALTETIEQAQRETQRYQKFSIVSLDASQSVQPLFSVCNPGAPSLWSDIYRGRRYTERDFEQRFVGAAERVIGEVSEPAQATTSPIIEYVRRWLGGDDFNATVGARRLVLISDMRQNSPLYSMYHARGQGFAEIVHREFGPAAEGVSFDVYFVSHRGDREVSEDEVRAAWDQAFEAIEATYSWRQIT